MRLGANGSGQRPHGKWHPCLPATTDQVCPQRSQPSLHCFLLADQRLLKKVFYDKGWEAISFPFSSKRSARKLQSSSSNHSAPLHYHQGKASHLCARWLLGHPPLGLNLPPENDKINFYCIFFHYQLINSISFTYADLFKQNLVPITHFT